MSQRLYMPLQSTGGGCCTANHAEQQPTSCICVHPTYYFKYPFVCPYSRSPLLMSSHAPPRCGAADGLWLAAARQLTATPPLNECTLQMSRSFALQVTIPYQWDRLHRPDAALLQYGFFQKGRRPPLLASIDYGGPGGETLRAGCQFHASPLHDDAYRELPSAAVLFFRRQSISWWARTPVLP